MCHAMPAPFRGGWLAPWEKRQEGAGMTTKAEQETIVRWDQEDQQAHLYTASEAQAKRRTTLG